MQDDFLNSSRDEASTLELLLPWDALLKLFT